MSRTKEIHYATSITVNLGNYENAKVEIGEVVELEKGDDVEKETKALISRVTKTAEKRAEVIRARLSNQKGD